MLEASKTGWFDNIAKLAKRMKNVLDLLDYLEVFQNGAGSYAKLRAVSVNYFPVKSTREKEKHRSS